MLEVSAGQKDKAFYLSQSTTMSNSASTIDNQWDPNILARGALLLARGDQKQAQEAFDTVLRHSGNNNLLALMGKARILLTKKQYRPALKYYQNILTQNPLITPDPRIGIGLCFWFLGQKDLAFQAWERSLELYPDSVTANLLVGLFKYNKAFSKYSDTDPEEFKTNYRDALSHINIAYKKESNNPAACVILAAYMYSKQNFVSVINLCEKALAYSDLPAIQSEAHFWIARSFYHQKQFVQAEEYFKKAIDSMGSVEFKALESSKGTADLKNIVLSEIGRGQSQLAQGNIPEAIVSFERTVKNNPKCLEAVFILGMLYSKGSNNKNAIPKLLNYVRLSGDSKSMQLVEILHTLSRLHEGDNNTKALDFLSKAVTMTQELGVQVPAEAQNNLGVFHYDKGNFESAKSLFQVAYDDIKSKLANNKDQGDNKDTEHYQSLLVTLKFNLARSDEAAGNIQEACKQYEEILSEEPDYVSASIRLCYLDILDDISTGEEKIKKILDEEPNDLEVRSLFGWYLRRQKMFNPKLIAGNAESEHHKSTLLNNDHKHDCFALISLGNVYCTIAREIRPSTPPELEKKNNSYRSGAQLFMKALNIDPQNVFAAQGIAIILCETKQFSVALEIFRKIRETLNDVSIYINMGHCLVELRQYAKAIESYEIAFKRFSNGKDTRYLSLLGKAWYLRGMEEKSLEALQTALDYSNQALELSPDNQGFKFNVAFVQFQIADSIRKISTGHRTIEDIEGASKGLEEAITSFEEIAASKYPPYAPADIKMRADMAKNTVRKQLKSALNDQEEYNENAKHKIAEARKIRENERAKLETERRIKEEAEARRQQKIAEERKKLQEQAQEWVSRTQDELMNEENEEPKPKRGNGRRGQKKEDFIDSDDGDDNKSVSSEDSAKGTDDEHIGNGEFRKHSKKKNRRRKSGPVTDADRSSKRRKLVKKQYRSEERVVDSDEDMDSNEFEDGKENGNGDDSKKEKEVNEEKKNGNSDDNMDDLF